MCTVKCACGDENCKIQIKIYVMDGEIHLWFTDKNGEETLMYLDPNTVVELIHVLKSVLLDVCNN